MLFTQLFGNWRRIVLLMVISSITFFFLIFFSHINFIMELLSGETRSYKEAIQVFADAWYWSLMDLSFFQLGADIIIAMLFGMNIMSMLHMIRLQKAAFVSAMSLASAGALVSALFGLLCISCGFLFIIPVISLFGASFLLLLPFRGFEFNVLSIMLLTASLWLTYKKFPLFDPMRPTR